MHTGRVQMREVIPPEELLTESCFSEILAPFNYYFRHYLYKFIETK